ncbi:MAG: right-handed parallel beta-helix repeat-containing protein [Phycisphaerales bacterium]|nr:right-handed parallel beta-helix repeat-containing protein [Phycisphaerales bacterium]
MRAFLRPLAARAVLGLVFCTAVMLSPRAGADRFDVASPQFDPMSPSNFDPKDLAFDDARRFRLAYAAAVRAGGGTIYVPAGAPWVFETADPADPKAESHVMIRSPAIRIEGDARGGGPASADFGSVITSTTTRVALFKVSPLTADGVLGGGRAPNGTVFENLQLTRAAGMEGGGDENADLNPTGAAILIDNAPGGETFVYRTLVRNCRIENQHTGIRSMRRSANAAARATHLTIENCEISHNAVDGVFLQDWGSIVCVGSFFQNNGRDGLRAFAYRPYWGGTMNIAGCGFGANGNYGLRLRRYLTYVKNQGWQPRDVHITGTQFDANGAGAILARNCANINLSGCSITANGRDPDFSHLPAADFGACNAVTIAALTFDANAGPALELRDCQNVSVTAANFIASNTADDDAEAGVPMHPAVRVNAGRQIAFGACAFSSTLTQTWGIEVLGLPRGLVMTGLTFDEGTIWPVIAEHENPYSGVRIEYLDPAGFFRVWPAP